MASPAAPRALATLTWSFAPDAASLGRIRAQESGWQVEHLRRRGVVPATVIDVGAANGTAKLYESFPEARLVLIEPLAEHEAALAELTAERGEYHLTAVGDREGTATILVDHTAPLISSMLPRRQRVAGTAAELEEREIPITTLDTLRRQHDWEPPFVLKIDTEGYEVRVIEGAAELLADTDLVIAEVNMTRRFLESYTFAEFIALMDSHGFSLVDVLSGHKAARAANMVCMDGVFRRLP